MTDDSGQKQLLDITIMNKKCMLWLGHVMKRLTDGSNSLGACRIPTGTHYIGMEQCSMLLPILHSMQLWIMNHCFRLGTMKVIMLSPEIRGN